MTYRSTLPIMVITFALLFLTDAVADKIFYEFDSLHRLTRVERSDGSSTIYEYDDLGNRTSYIVSAGTGAPSAAFSALNIRGNLPLEVSFTNQSTGGVIDWLWDFGDGQTSTEPNPIHTYQNPGFYTVSLTVTGAGDSDTETKTEYITVTDQDHPLANFTAGPLDGPLPLTVQFSDRSAGNVTSWAWDFDNDGTVDSTDQHPSHVFTTTGSFDVKLTVSDGTNPNSMTRPQYISVDAASQTPVLNIVPDTRFVSALGGETSFEISNTGIGTMSWTAVANDGWLTITNGSNGENSGSLTVIYAPNEGPERTGTITVTAPGADSSPQTLTIQQATNTGPIISIASPAAGEVWTLGSARTIQWTITSDHNIESVNVYYHYNGEDDRLVTFTTDPGVYDWTIPANNSYISQTARIRIRATDENGQIAEKYSDYFSIQDSDSPPLPWHVPERLTSIPDPGLSFISQDNHQASIETDGSGDLHMVYRFVEDDLTGLQSGGSGERVVTQKLYYQKKENGSWLTPVEIFSPVAVSDQSHPGFSISNLRIAMDSNNHPHVSFIQEGGPTDDCTENNEREVYYLGHDVQADNIRFAV